MDARNPLILRRFEEMGQPVDDAMEAFANFPLGGVGQLKMPLTFDKWRILARVGTKVELWVAWTGQTPRRLIAEYPLSGLRVVRLGRWRYDRIALGPKRLWVHRRDRDQVANWIALGG